MDIETLVENVEDYEQVQAQSVAQPPVVQFADTKKCSRCGEDKPLSEFYINRQARDGLTCYCKSCTSIRHAEWSAANLEHVREYRHAYYLRKKAEAQAASLVEVQE